MMIAAGWNLSACWGLLSAERVLLKRAQQQSVLEAQQVEDVFA